jgi:hypothetical protein
LKPKEIRNNLCNVGDKVTGNLIRYVKVLEAFVLLWRTILQQALRRWREKDDNEQHENYKLL